jgi:hypothetical protein
MIEDKKETKSDFFLAFLTFISLSYHDMFYSGALVYSRFTVLTDIGD